MYLWTTTMDENMIFSESSNKIFPMTSKMIFQRLFFKDIFKLNLTSLSYWWKIALDLTEVQVEETLHGGPKWLRKQDV